MLVMRHPRRHVHRGLHDPDHLVLLLRRAAGRGHGPHPARVRAPHRRPADHPGRPRRGRRLRQPARQRGPLVRARVLRPPVRALRRAHRRAFLSSATVGPDFGHPEFVARDRHRLERASAIARRRPRLPLVLEGQGPARDHRAQQGRPPRLHDPREQVLLRLALHRRHRRRHQGPHRPGRQLVQPERARRHRQPGRHVRPRAPASGSTTTSTRAWSTPLVNGSGAGAEGPASCCASSRPARSRPTAPTCSERPPSWPPSSSSSPAQADQRRDREGPAQRLGAQPPPRSCLWWAPR